MKKIIFYAFLLIGITTFSQTETKTDKGVLEFESEVIDYGKIKQNEDGKRTFKFKNTGNAPITIAKVKGSCGCTVATKPNKPIMPGETAEIGVEYATNRLGGFSKTITITSDASQERKVLRIKGMVQKQQQSQVSPVVAVTE